MAPPGKTGAMNRGTNKDAGDWITGHNHSCRLQHAVARSSFRFRVLRKRRLAANVVRMAIHAPLVAANAKPGQFMLLRPGEHSERIPLTISNADLAEGTVTIVFQESGVTTRELAKLKRGDYVHDLAGPLGTPSEIAEFGTVACVGGGVGIAVMLPIARALRQAGNRVVGIIGARTRELVLLEKDMREACDDVLVMTDDGSYGGKGLVTDALAELIAREPVHRAYAIGPLPMMFFVCKLTKEHGIKTIVSLDPVMVDGTGMCGGCRVLVGGEATFTCVDGPEFDGHLVDWDTLKARKAIYKDEEQFALQAALEREGKDAEA